jgi:predicted DNA-binding transcriptional regulator AlpA
MEKNTARKELEPKKEKPMGRVLTKTAVAKLIGVGRSTLYEHYLTDPAFPKMRVFGRGHRAYLDTDIHEYLNNRDKVSEAVTGSK